MTALRLEAQNPSTPLPASEPARALVNLTSCAASGAWVASSVVDVRDTREITVLVAVNANTAASGAVSFKPMISCAVDQPLSNDDVWFGIGDVDTVTATDLSGAVPSGADWTLSPESAVRVVRDLVIKSELSNAATDEYRLSFTLKVTGARWFHLAYAETGDTGTPSNVTIQYVRHS